MLRRIAVSASASASASAVRPVLRPPRVFNARCKGGRSAQLAMPKMRPQQSHRIAAQELGELPSDMGLLPKTFIMPTGDRRPSLLLSPVLRLKLEWARAKQRAMDWRDKLVFMFVTKSMIRLREPKKTALALHCEMYTAFAQGDVETLRLICGEGLLDSFQKRLMARGRTRVEWNLHRYIKRPRVVSHKAAQYAGTALSTQQVVVRIHSLQSLAKYTPQGKVVEGTNIPRPVVEYLVVEKKVIAGVEQPWHVWGTTTETADWLKAK